MSIRRLIPYLDKMYHLIEIVCFRWFYLLTQANKNWNHYIFKFLKKFILNSVILERSPV